MLLDGAGELVADAMTANRSLAWIPSASSILDTSNYTIQAISYGKNYQGFKNHAHRILSPSSDGIIKVLSYESNTVSSYHSSATASALEYSYKSYPRTGSPMDTRLELNSTISVYSSGVGDYGQCSNPIITSSLSSFAHVIGCYPHASGTKYWLVSSADNPAGSIICSGVLSSLYNLSSSMDSRGFYKFYPGSAVDHIAARNANIRDAGAWRLNINAFPTLININWSLPPGDAGALLLFGGINHIGLWSLDMKTMLKQGIYPPYTFDPLNNKRSYKLFAKKTFNSDLLYVKDFNNNSGFNTTFSGAISPTGAQRQYYTWDLKFI